MPSRKKQEVREEFLSLFTEILIRNSLPKDFKSEQEKAKKVVLPAKQMVKEISIPKRKAFVPVVPRIPPRIPQVTPPKIQVPPRLPNSQQGPQGRINLGKVAQFLKDPSVLSVECTGPGKNILVNRSGAIQTTSATLTKEEIDQILGEISQQTQIPIVPGLFKALYKNLLITAVVSDYVGTRFIIQKRMPF
jgi:hypothetical protein